MRQDYVAIVDLGDCDAVYFARNIRDMEIYCELHNYDVSINELNSLGNLKGVILCKGNKPMFECSDEMKNAGVPILTVNDATPLKDVENFIINDCKAKRDWNMENFIESQVKQIKDEVKDKKVLLALSGGVDSSVVAALLYKAIGENLVCVHVNHGLLRKDEPEQVIKVFKEKFGMNLIYCDASKRFLDRLKDVNEPEKKRKIIGDEFINVFAEEASKLNGIEYLAQGTIYPDIIESGTKTHKGVKAHHNVGGLPEKLNFKLIEPVKQLFKDEVRKLGIALSLPKHMVYRQPFPGPGLGVRCLGAITEERLTAVRESDAILRDEFEKTGLSEKVWQYFTIVPEFKSVGVKNNERTYCYSVIIRAINTVDAMTATIEPIEYEILQKISNRILNEVKNVNRVCYDLTQKPPGTIEWE